MLKKDRNSTVSTSL